MYCLSRMAKRKEQIARISVINENDFSMLVLANKLPMVFKANNANSTHIAYLEIAMNFGAFIILPLSSVSRRHIASMIIETASKTIS